MLDFAIHAFVTLFFIVDPIGLAPIFNGLMNESNFRQKVKLALTATLIASGILIVFIFSGNAIISVIGITLPAFRIAGGLLLFLVAMEMLFARRNHRRDEHTNIESNNSPLPSNDLTDSNLHDIAIFPIAVPLIAGPSAMTSVILFADQGSADWVNSIVLVGVVGSVMAITFVVLCLSHFIIAKLGRHGTALLTRIFGLLLAALSVQFVLDGISGWMQGLQP